MPPTWTNWSGSVTCRPEAIETPTTEAGLIASVRRAAAAGQTIRVVGTGHSFVPLCASDGMLISLDGLQGVISTNRAAGQATVWAGTKIHQLGQPLLEAGLAMENMGDIDRQAMAGAICTATHGTGRSIGNISTQVAGLRLILASGEVVNCSADIEPDLFKAAQVSLGLVGLISQVSLRLLPAYRLHEQTGLMPFQDCFDQLDSLIAANRHFEFFWLSKEDACAVKRLNLVGATLDKALTPTLSQREREKNISDSLQRYINQERIDYSHRIFPSERNRKFNEMEFALPAENGPDCLLEIRQLMLTQFAEVRWPIEYRTVAADDIYLSPHYGRDSVTISIHQAHNLPHQAFFAAAEAIFRNHRGRPHWGKMHSHTAQELRDLYPRWDQFQAVRRRVDPDGRFLNDYLRAF